MTRQTLPQRLKRRTDFLRLAAEGGKTVRPGFLLQAVRTKTPAPPRIGFTATRKLGNAVSRNRAKRRLREAARLALAGREAAGLELVLVARRETGAMDFAALRRNLAGVLDLVLGEGQR